MIDRATLRGAVIFVAWLLAPVGVLAALVRAGVDALTGPLILVVYIVYPHASFVHRTGDTVTRLFSPGAAMVVAIVQWALVMAVFALITRRLRAAHQIWIAPLIVVAVGVVVSLVASALGITIPLMGEPS